MCKNLILLILTCVCLITAGRYTENNNYNSEIFLNKCSSRKEYAAMSLEEFYLGAVDKDWELVHNENEYKEWYLEDKGCLNVSVKDSQYSDLYVFFHDLLIERIKVNNISKYRKQKLGNIEAYILIYSDENENYEQFITLIDNKEIIVTYHAPDEIFEKNYAIISERLMGI